MTMPALRRATAAALVAGCLVLAVPAPALAETTAPGAGTTAIPAQTATPTAEPTATASADVTPTAQPTPTAGGSPTPGTTPTTEPSPTPTASPTDDGHAVLESDPPAWRDHHVDTTSWIIALIVLAACLVLVVLLARRPDRYPSPEPSTTRASGEGPDGSPDRAAAGLAALEAVGEAMLDAGYSVTGVRSTMEDIAAVNGVPATEIVVFPTALFVSAREAGEVRTGAVSTGSTPLRLNQIDALDDVIREARTRPLDPDDITARVRAMRVLPPPYSPSQRVAAYVLLSGGLAVLLGGSWAGVAVAAALGGVAGFVLLKTENIQRQYEALVTVGLAFAVSTIVFTLTQIGLDPGVLAALIAPLVILLPGGLLTTGVVELATGQMMAGAGRLAAGTMQLILLAAGVVAGASVVGVPRLELDQSQNPLGPAGPWIAVALYGVGIVIHQCGRPRSTAWILLVLYVAYGAQVVADLFFGGVLSAMLGAFAMTPVAYLVSQQRSGPAAFASFLPAFWLLVPGSLGLVGVTSILDGDSAGLNTLVTTGSTMVSIMLGILAGSALGSRLAGKGTVAAI